MFDIKDPDIFLYPVKTPLKTKGQIMLELADKAGKHNLAFVLLQRGDITLVDFLIHETQKVVNE